MMFLKMVGKHFIDSYCRKNCRMIGVYKNCVFELKIPKSVVTILKHLSSWFFFKVKYFFTKCFKFLKNKRDNQNLTA